MLSPLTERQFEKLQVRYPEAKLEALPSGAALISIPNFQLPAGWNASSTEVKFIVPVGYPGPAPDCFWTDAGLRLADGRMPQNAQDTNPIPEVPGNYLWFSWHVWPATQWHPSRDDLMTYVSIIRRRFEQLQ
jgi:hypothetical protein